MEIVAGSVAVSACPGSQNEGEDQGKDQEEEPFHRAGEADKSVFQGNCEYFSHVCLLSLADAATVENGNRDQE